jgi:hypothetical protein
LKSCASNPLLVAAVVMIDDDKNCKPASIDHRATARCPRPVTISAYVTVSPIVAGRRRQIAVSALLVERRADRHGLAVDATEVVEIRVAKERPPRRAAAVRRSEFAPLKEVHVSSALFV